jgi:hypothetical protein
MDYTKKLVTNFAYGTGPYLRTTELAIAFNTELEKRGVARLQIIVPLVYGEKQKKIMLEEFGTYIEAHPYEIVLDSHLGSLLKEVFFTGQQSYEDTLRRWIQSEEDVGARAHAYLSGELHTTTFSGEACHITGSDITLEINRSPRVAYNIAQSYSTTFGNIADILERSLQEGEQTIAVSSNLLKEGVMLADSIEGVQTLRMMAYPATFSHNREYVPRYSDEVLVPPITDLPQAHEGDIERGIFVTITGIEGLERLYREAESLGLKLYSNDVDAVPNATKALPHIIPNKNVALQFARAGWGSIWLSMFADTPLVVPEFDPTDDPEIYFNNRAVESLGIGAIYRGQPLDELLGGADVMRAHAKKLREDIMNRWGTLNGNQVCAEHFADAFLKSR